MLNLPISHVCLTPVLLYTYLKAVKGFIDSNKYQTSTSHRYRVNPVGLIFKIKTMQIDAGHIKISSPNGGLLWASYHMDIVWYIGSSPRSDFLVPWPESSNGIEGLFIFYVDSIYTVITAHIISYSRLVAECATSKPKNDTTFICMVWDLKK